VGGPGAYDDNNGSYRVNIGVNETPIRTVPEGGSSAILLGLTLAAMGLGVRLLGSTPETS
jgi:hypothetical protein